jgi:uncharacterized protein YllA (UPF0747 family)
MNKTELHNKLNQKSKEQFYLQVHAQTPQYIKEIYDISVNNNTNVKDILKNNNITRTQYEFMCKNYMSIPEYRKNYFGKTKNFMCRNCDTHVSS